MANPFKPTAGKMPPILIGRQSVIDDFERGLRNGAGAPERLMLIMGQRGFGKTVMLTQLGEIARSQGWEVYSDTASNNLISRLVAKLETSKRRVGQINVAPSIDMAGVADIHLGDVQLVRAQQTVELRDLIEARLKKLPRGKGILLTIDESQAASREDLIALATTVQHVIADEDLSGRPDDEKQGIALALAALPNIVDDLINEKVLTFLRRAKREELGAIPIPDVRNAYTRTVAQSGKHIGIAAAARAAQITEGNPYLVQLVGYYTWECADARGSDVIEEDDVELGVQDALHQYGEAVCAPSLYGLTSSQQDFLRAMADDYPAPSKVADIAKRLGKSSSWADKYRASLIKAHMIASAGRGLVEFSIPHFGEWLA